MYKLILASQSPRRRQLLEQAGFLIHVSSLEVSENIDVNINPTTMAQMLARRKCEAWVNSNNALKNQKILVLAADTLVAISGRVLRKKKNISEAQYYLGLLSGQTHSVITGVCVYAFDSEVYFESAVTTKVEFRALEDDEISKYIASGEPMDKAGAYGIQGEGRRFVKTFEGSWSNVVGLPMEYIETLFKENNWDVGRK